MGTAHEVDQDREDLIGNISIVCAAKLNRKEAEVGT